MMPTSPAAAVRGPEHVVKTGRTPVLEAEWRKLLAPRAATSLRDLRERALIATLSYSFARINAGPPRWRSRTSGRTARMDGEPARKGGNQHAMTCHHALAEVLHDYIDPLASPQTVRDGLFRSRRSSSLRRR